MEERYAKEQPKCPQMINWRLKCPKIIAPNASKHRRLFSHSLYTSNTTPISPGMGLDFSPFGPIFCLAYPTLLSFRQKNSRFYTHSSLPAQGWYLPLITDAYQTILLWFTGIRLRFSWGSLLLIVCAMAGIYTAPLPAPLIGYLGDLFGSFLCNGWHL